MTRSVRALPVLLAVVAAVSAVAAAPALGRGGPRLATQPPAVAVAADAAPAGARAAVAPTASSSVLALAPATGSTVDVAVDPGGSVTRAIDLTNRSGDLQLTVRLGTVDAAARGGHVQFASSARPGGPPTWVDLSDVVVTIQPHGHVRFSMNVGPPANADPGTLVVGLVARVQSALRTSDDASVRSDASASLAVHVRVKGAATALVSIVSVTAVQDHGHGALQVTFQNSGATANTMVGHVGVRGTAPRSIPLRAQIAPLTHTSVRVPFTLPSGKASVPVSVIATDAAGDQAEWTGDVSLAPPPAPAGKHVGTAAHAGEARAVTGASASARHGRSWTATGLHALVVLALAAAAVWFGAEIRRSLSQRRARPSVRRVRAAAVADDITPPARPRRRRVRPAVAQAPPTADAIAVAVAVPDRRAASGSPDPMAAIAAQLGALVDSIDRLVARLGDGIPAPIGAARPPTPVASTSEAAPAEAPSLPDPRQPAAVREHGDPFDWPSEAQLQRYEDERRDAVQTELG